MILFTRFILENYKRFAYTPASLSLSALLSPSLTILPDFAPFSLLRTRDNDSKKCSRIPSKERNNVRTIHSFFSSCGTFYAETMLVMSSHLIVENETARNILCKQKSVGTLRAENSFLQSSSSRCNESFPEMKSMKPRRKERESHPCHVGHKMSWRAGVASSTHCWMNGETRTKKCIWQED